MCFKEVQDRYDRSEKGRARHSAYNHTGKGKERAVTYRATDKRADVLARYDQSPKGWMNGLRRRRTKALQRRKQRKEAEDS